MATGAFERTAALKDFSLLDPSGLKAKEAVAEAVAEAQRRRLSVTLALAAMQTAATMGE